MSSLSFWQVSTPLRAALFVDLSSAIVSSEKTFSSALFHSLLTALVNIQDRTPMVSKIWASRCNRRSFSASRLRDCTCCNGSDNPSVAFGERSAALYTFRFFRLKLYPALSHWTLPPVGKVSRSDAVQDNKNVGSLSVAQREITLVLSWASYEVRSYRPNW